MMGFRFQDYGDAPGPSAAVETNYEAMLRWGMFGQGVIASAAIDGTTRDAGNTPTTELRCGLLLGQIAASGNLRDYGDSNTDGSDIAYGILLEGLRITDFDGNNLQKFVGVLVGGPVMASRVFGLTEQARQQMAGRFIFDDRPWQTQNLSGSSHVIPKTANYTVLNGTDNGTLFTTTGNGGAIVFTLPTTIQKGQAWTFYNTVGQNMTITAPAGKLVAFNNAAATNVAFTTAGSLIGGCVHIVVDDTGSKYLVENWSAGANAITVS